MPNQHAIVPYEELSRMADQIGRLKAKYIQAPLGGLYLPSESKAEFERIVLEATSLLDSLFGRGNDFSNSLVAAMSNGTESYAGGPSYSCAKQIPEFIKGAANHLRREESLKHSRAEVSDASSSIVCRPNVFRHPEREADDAQVAVMMPFLADFKPTYDAIRRVCTRLGLRAVRADDIWEDTTFVQDIFGLIYCSRITIVDFSGKNPNVMYETGIAHTLGKQVIPITRSIDDVPSDLRHHRALIYLPNSEGLASLESSLTLRLSTITGRETGENEDLAHNSALNRTDTALSHGPAG